MNFFQWSIDDPLSVNKYGIPEPTSNKIVYLTGTPDKHLRAYNVETGKLIWEYEMLNAGSSPPLIFHKDNKAYIAVMATGGKFFGYDKSPNLMYIFEI